jgi:hypothetical protein
MADELSETSGAARKRRKRDQAKLDARSGEDDGRWANAFKKLGQPDFDNPETGMAWVRRVQLMVAYQQVTTPFPSAYQQATWKRFDNMSKSIGMTHAKSSLEDTIAKLRKELDARREAGGTVVEESGASVPRPSTARGAPRGPRPLPITATADVPDSARRPD